LQQKLVHLDVRLQISREEFGSTAALVPELQHGVAEVASDVLALRAELRRMSDAPGGAAQGATAGGQVVPLVERVALEVDPDRESG